MSAAERQLAALMRNPQPEAPGPKLKSVPTPVLKEGDIHLGNTAAGIQIGMDLAKLIDGRLLIQGNSGAGKSMLLRRLFEQAFGRVQQLLVDLDGEFSTLSENFDVAVLTAADVQRVGCKAFAFHLREHRYSAVLDLSDATSEDQLTIIADLAAGLLEAPEAHWYPLLVEIDEAQKVAPHYDTGDIEADTRKRAIATLADLMGRGRKRGIAGIIATQRLSETAKAVAAKATNIIVGRTFLDRDVDRAGGLLGFTAGQSRPLRTLADGEFICLGPAIAGPTRIRFRTGPVQSRHKGRAPALVAPPSISAENSLALLHQVPSAAEQIGQGETRGRSKPGVRGRDWRPEEDAIIRAGYAESKSIAVIGAELAAIGFSTSTSNISGRAHALGLKSAIAGVHWSDREDEIVRDAYAREVKIFDITKLLAAEGFTRSRQSIQMRAIALDITLDRVNYWQPEEERIALAAINAGKSTREVIADLAAAGYDRRTGGIAKFCARHNIVRGLNQPWTAEDEQTLRTMYAEKKPVKDICTALGKTKGAVATMASKLGVMQRQAWTDEEKQKLVELHASGIKLVDCVAQMPGRTYATIARMSGIMRLDFVQNRSKSK